MPNHKIRTPRRHWFKTHKVQCLIGIQREMSLILRMVKKLGSGGELKDPDVENLLATDGTKYRMGYPSQYSQGNQEKEGAILTGTGN